jgi:DNA polymerase-3 subunit beta
MKLTFDRASLLHDWEIVSLIVPRRCPKPILQNVKLEATSDGATLMATDLEIEVRIELQGIQVEVPGAVVLPIGRFGSILRESSDERLYLEGSGGTTRIRGERSEFELLVENPGEFPEVALFGEQRYHKLPARLFRELVRRTIFATDAESSRYALGGVLIELTADRITATGDHITAVATDGRRLACQQGPTTIVGTQEKTESAILPARSLQVVERALADNEEEIWLAVRENEAVVKSQRTTLSTRLVEGRFPKWRDVFPRMEQMTRIELSVGPFYSAVRQAAILTSEGDRGVDFTFGDGKAVLLTRGAKFGQSRIELPIGYDGPELPVTLDPRFLGDFLRVLDPDAPFTLYVHDPESAVVAQTEDGYRYVLMPMQRE